MFAQRKSVTVAVDASGDATAYISVPNGRVMSIHYVKDGTTPYADGVDFTITVEQTGEGIWTESNVNLAASKYPRVGVHDVIGGVALRVAAGLPLVEPIYMAEDRIKIVIAQGGVSKTGKFIAIIG